MRIYDIANAFIMVKNSYEGTTATSIIAAGYRIFWNSSERPLDSSVNHKRAFLKSTLKAEQITGAVLITATTSAIVGLAACKIFIPVFFLTPFLLLIMAVAIHSLKNPPKIPSAPIQVQQQIIYRYVDEQESNYTPSLKVVAYLESFGKESLKLYDNLEQIALHIETLSDKQFLIDQNHLRYTEADYVFDVEFKKRVSAYYNKPFNELSMNEKINWCKHINPFVNP